MAHQSKSKTKFMLGCIFVPLGLIAAVIGMGTGIPFNNLLFAAGLVLVASGFMEWEIAAVWAALEGGGE